MALDPTRRTGTTPTGVSAVSVSVLWVQRVLNALGADPRLVEDGVWGPATQAALAHYGAPLAVDPSAGRLLLSPALEATLGGTSSSRLAIGLSIAATAGIYFLTRTRAKPRGLRGLRGTVPEHRARAEEYIRQARGLIAEGRRWARQGRNDHAANAAQHAQRKLDMAFAEARWLPGGCTQYGDASRGTVCGTVQALHREALLIERGAE